jgi:hypothetical protein
MQLYSTGKCENLASGGIPKTSSKRRDFEKYREECPIFRRDFPQFSK